MIQAFTNNGFPSRIQLTLGDWQGPFAQEGTSPPVLFDPTVDLEVYVDGEPLKVLSAAYDSINNRYLLYMERAFNLQGVVQVLYHMASPPFQYGATV